MALGESGGVQVAPITYGSAKRKPARPKKGPSSKGPGTVRPGGKQSFFITKRGKKR